MKEASTFIIRLYFAVVAAVTIFTLMWGTIDLINMGLKTWAFPAADVPSYLESCQESAKYRYPDETINDEEYQAQCEARNQEVTDNYVRTKAQDAVQNLAMIIVALPLFILHFRVVLRDWKRMNGEEKKSKK